MLSFKIIFEILLLAHILADFYLQSQRMAECKTRDLKIVVKHSLVYALFYLVFILCLIPTLSIKLVLILIIGHAVIDLLKYYITNKYLRDNSRKLLVFILDQICHIFLIILIGYWVIKSQSGINLNQSIISFFQTLNISVFNMLSLSLKIMIVSKPVNIFISLIIKPYKKFEEVNEEEMKAGRMIGILERLIMLFFILINQYASVGLVLTAKSITRFNKIAEDKVFAEYYLLGTLLSTICVLVISSIY